MRGHRVSEGFRRFTSQTPDSCNDALVGEEKAEDEEGGAC